MLSWWAVALVLPAVCVALVDWRKGLLAVIVVALLQDPARKLEPAAPVYFTLLAGVVFAAAYVRSLQRGRFLPTRFVGGKTALRMPFIAFGVLLALQAAHSLAQYGNPVMVGIGALSYLAPLPALLLGYAFAVKSGRAGIEQWFSWYLVGVLIVLPTILLEYAGVEWETLGEVGAGIMMFQDDSILTAHSGFFRASETAAWHAAMAVCVLLLLGSMRRISHARIVAVVVIIAGLLLIGVLTGRRKIFVEIVIFLSVYVALLALFRKGGTKLAATAVVGGLLSYGAVTWFVAEPLSDLARQDSAGYRLYAQRSATVAEGVGERGVGLGLAPVTWALERYGWLGGGLGIASQGAQQFGGGAEVYGGAGEGGPGKITAELGLPGLVLALWIAGVAGRYAWQVLVFVVRRSVPVTRLACALLALLVANLAVFFVATQVFGDMFVLLLLGLVSGFFLATPVLAERERVQAQAAPAPAPVMRPRAVPRTSVVPGGPRP